MARPKKIGLEYFPLDCQMDDKVEMLEAEHGLEGFGVYIKLLQAIYQTEAGELDMSVIFRWKTLGKSWGIPAENLRKMVDTMLEVSLFDKLAFEGRQVLTSGGIQKRISSVSALRDRDRTRKTDGKPEFSDGKPAEKYTKGKGKDTNVSQKEKEIESSSLRSEDAASAAAPVEEESQPVELPFESPTPGLRTPGGPADVATRKPAKAKPTPGSSNPADYQLPEWATTPFVEEFATWLNRRQTRPDCKPLQAAAVQARLNELARYDESFCLRLFEQAAQNPNWQGLTFDNTPHKFTQHVLQLQQLQVNANRLNQPERGAKPTEAAAYGARTLSAQLRAIREERAAQNGSHVHLGTAAGAHAGLGSAVPPGIGAP